MNDLGLMKKLTADIFEGIGSSRFLEWIEEQGFYIAPSSREFHGAVMGGNWEHGLQVGHELMIMTEEMGLKWERPQSPLIIGMLHDFCKLDDYRFTTEGKIERNPESICSGHGEKSLLMLMGHIELTEEEKMCIRYHMGAFTDPKEWSYYSRAVKKYPNVLWTHTADMIASQIRGI